MKVKLTKRTLLHRKNVNSVKIKYKNQITNYFTLWLQVHCSKLFILRSSTFQPFHIPSPKYGCSSVDRTTYNITIYNRPQVFIVCITFWTCSSAYSPWIFYFFSRATLLNLKWRNLLNIIKIETIQFAYLISIIQIACKINTRKSYGKDLNSHLMRNLFEDIDTNFDSTYYKTTLRILILVHLNQFSGF